MSGINEQIVKEVFDNHFDTATPKDVIRECEL